MVQQIATLGVTIETASAKAALRDLAALTAEATKTEKAFAAFQAATASTSKSVADFSKALKGVQASLETFTLDTRKARDAVKSLGLMSSTASGRLKTMGTQATATGSRVQTLGNRAEAAAAKMAALNTATTSGTRRMATMENRAATTSAAVGSIGRSSQRTQRQFREFTQSATSHAEGFMGVVLRLAAVFGGIRLTLAGIQTIAAFEDIQDTFTSLRGGDAIAGRRDFEFARQFARTSPQTLEEVSSAIVGLRNNQIDPTESLLRLFSDVASVTSDQRGAFVQMVKLWQRGQQGGLGVEELDILANRGVNVYGILQERLGLSRREIGDFAQDAESARIAVKALQEGFEELYSGASLRRIDNLSVRWNAFLDTMKAAAEAVGVGLGESMHRSLDGFSNFIDRNSESFEKLGVGIGSVINSLTLMTQGFVLLNQVLGNIPFYIFGAIMGLFASSGILKVLRLISPIGFIKRSAVTVAGAGIGAFNALRDLRHLGGRQGEMFGGMFSLGAEGQRLADAQGIHSQDMLRQLREQNILMGAGLSRRGVIDESTKKRMLAVGNIGAGLGAMTTRMGVLGTAITRAFSLLTNPVTIVSGIAAITAGLGSNIASLTLVNDQLEEMNEKSASFREVMLANVQILRDQIPDAIDKFVQRMKGAFDELTRDSDRFYVGPGSKAGMLWELIKAGAREATGLTTEQVIANRFVQANEDPNNPGFLRYGPPRRGGYRSPTAFGADPIDAGYRRFMRSTLGDRVHTDSVANRLMTAGSLDLALRRWQAATRTLSGEDLGESSLERGRRARKIWQANSRTLIGHDLDESTLERGRRARKVWQANARTLIGLDLPDSENTWARLGRSRRFWQGMARGQQGIDLPDSENTLTRLGNARLRWQGNARIQQSITIEEETSAFAEAVGTQLTGAFRTITGSGSEAIHDMVDSLGRDLTARVLDHHIGEPFRQLLTSVMDEMFAALTDGQWWRSGSVGDLTSAIAGLWGTGTVDVPSYSGGGYTGSGARVGGVDGRGGFPAILHPGETVIDHMRGGRAAPQVIIKNMGPPINASARPSADGRSLEIEIDRKVAAAISGGRNTGKALENVWGQNRQATG